MIEESPILSTLPAPESEDIATESLSASNTVHSAAAHVGAAHVGAAHVGAGDVGAGDVGAGEFPNGSATLHTGNPNTGNPSQLPPQQPHSKGFRSKKAQSKAKRRTNHLKEVPPERELRNKVRDHCRQLTSGWDKQHALSQAELESEARQVLERFELPEAFLGWTLVVLSSEFWRDQIAIVPPERRLLLLPHCLKHTEGCPADYDQYGLDCKQCGACCIADFRTRAEQLGYKVLVAEGSPIVLKIIVSGYVDAIVGVACLNVLEKVFDKILLVGIPCMAVPLLSSDCRNTSVDEDWVSEMIEVRPSVPTVQTYSYLPLLRAASGMFQPEQLQRLAPRVRVPQGLQNGGNSQNGDSQKLSATELRSKNGKSQQDNILLQDPIAATEALAHDYLAKGGKYSRPFITLAAYDALTGNHRDSKSDPEQTDLQKGEQTQLAKIPDAVYRVALSIETFHKASLVHDDIEDDDAYRYGEPTLHQTLGLPTAINVGDYLIGLGYRLVSRELESLGPDVAGDIINRLADAHLRLSEGQGAELLWRDARDKQLMPLDAMKIYALKTAPAFEAALLCGLRCAAPLEELEQPLKQFARHLGIAFQILNDLKDWQGDQDNKLAVGLDTLGGRPTLLWALALDSLKHEQRDELLQIVGQQQENNNTTTEPSELDANRIASVKQLYHQANVFDQARELVEKYQQRAEAIADDVKPESLRRLLYFLINTMLHNPAPPTPKVIELGGAS
jgi:geranylgeranyl pyrophosphate synthase